MTGEMRARMRRGKGRDYRRRAFQNIDKCYQSGSDSSEVYNFKLYYNQGEEWWETTMEQHCNLARFTGISASVPNGQLWKWASEANKLVSQQVGRYKRKPVAGDQ